MNIADYVITYWYILLALGTLAWWLVTMFFKVKALAERQEAFAEEQKEVKSELEKRNATDVVIADKLATTTDTTKRELTALIDRNKEAAELANTTTLSQLFLISNDVAIVKDRLGLIMRDAKIVINT